MCKLYVMHHEIGIGNVVLHKASSQDDHACAFGKHSFTVQPPDIYITLTRQNRVEVKRILQYVQAISVCLGKYIILNLSRKQSTFQPSSLLFFLSQWLLFPDSKQSLITCQTYTSTYILTLTDEGTFFFLQAPGGYYKTQCACNMLFYSKPI